MSNVPTTAPSLRTQRVIALACAAIAVLAAVGTIWATEMRWPDASALVGVSAEGAMASVALAADPDFELVPFQGHYDGVYYYTIALDPFAQGPEHELVDQWSYRYGRPLHGWLAALLALGQRAWIPEAMLLLTMIGIGASGYLASRLSAHYGRTPWGGLVIAMMPGLLFSATVSTTEPLGVALVIGLVLAWARRASPWLIALLSVLVCLDRGVLVTVIGGLVLFEIAQAIRRRSWPDGATWTRLVAAAVGPIVLAGWFVGLKRTSGSWPRPTETGNIDLPFRGWLETFQYARFLQLDGDLGYEQIGSTVASWLIAILVLLLTALWVARRVRTPVEGVLIAQVALVTLFSWRTLVYPHEMVREPLIAILAAVAVIALRPRASEPG